MRRNNKGFTLIEIMVVVVIAAVLISAVALSFPPVGDKLLKEHADRFSALIELAQDEAILQSNELALEITPNGYSFYQNVNNSWLAMSQSPFNKRVLENDFSTKMYLDGILIDLKDREKSKPQVVILSSGEMTPFTYSIRFQKESEISLKVDANGEIERTFLLKENLN